MTYQHWRVGTAAIARKNAADALRMHRAVHMGGWVDPKSRQNWVKEQRIVAGFVREN